jgi:hypothetical protein
MAEPVEPAESAESAEAADPAKPAEPAAAPAPDAAPAASGVGSAPDAGAALEADLAAAEADVVRLRAENAALAEEFRKEPSDSGREILKRAAASLTAARDRVDAAKTALEVLKKTGSPLGILAEGGRVVGAVAASIKPGASREERAKAIDDALAGPLADAASQLGVVLAAAPERYTRERPGRDAEGRTILDVAGRVEGDALVPAVSKASKNLRS